MITLLRQLTAAHRQRSLMVLLLLLGAALRLSGLNNGSPPGLEHDEVANWLIDQGILAGQHGVYFTAAYGHEAGFHYWQTLFVGLLGDNALALRLPHSARAIGLTTRRDWLPTAAQGQFVDILRTVGGAVGGRPFEGP